MPHNPAAAKASPQVTASVLLDETPPPSFSTWTIRIVAAALAAFLVWAQVMPLRELTIATGEILPSGFAREVQHLEGGTLLEILVEESDAVSAGQVIARMDVRDVRAELSRAKARARAAELSLERLAAVAEGRMAALEAAPVAGGAALLPTAMAAQLTLFDAQTASARAVLSRIDAEIDAAVRQVSALEAKVERLSAEKTIVSDALERRSPLMARGLVRLTEFESLQRDALRTEAELAAAEAELDRERLTIAGKEAERAEAVSRLREAALREVVDLQVERVAAEAEVTRLSDRLARAEITAPIDGAVKLLPARAPAVLQPGGLVAEIVPVDAQVIAEVRVSPTDIGHVEVGDYAMIKIDTYDFTRYGAIDGAVASISPSTLLDEQAEPYFRVRVTLAEDGLGAGAARLPLSPGMGMTAEILTGEKSLMQYLLRPFRAMLDRPLTER